MSTPPSLLPFALSEMTAQIAETGCITLADRYGLMAAILDETLSEEDRSHIDRLLRAVYRGKFKVVDELSYVV